MMARHVAMRQRHRSQRLSSEHTKLVVTAETTVLFCDVVRRRDNDGSKQRGEARRYEA